MEEKDKNEASKLIRKLVKDRLDEYQKDIYGFDIKSTLKEKIQDEEDIKILNNIKGLKSNIFQLLNIKDDNQDFGIYFQYVENDIVQIQWDDFDDQDYSELEEILCKYFNINYIFDGFDGFGSIHYHPDFKLTLELKTDTENQLIDKDDIGYYCAEYEITDNGIFEIEFGSTRMFWNSLN